MSKKRLSAMLAAVMVIVMMLSACGGSGNAASGKDGAGNGDGSKTSVTLWVLNDQTSYLEPIIKEFESKNPDIKVEPTYYGTDPLKESLKVAASSKTLPDMWFTWGGSLGSFYPENDLAMDLTQIAADHGWSDIYNPAALDLVKYNDKVYGVPFHLASLSVFYPKELYAKLNLNPPATFAEFEEQLQQMKDQGTTPFAVGGKGGWMLMRWVEQLIEHYGGPELHDQLNTLEASWDDPAVVQAFQKLKDWSDKGYFEKGFITLDPLEAETPMYHAQQGFAIEGAWVDLNIAEAGAEPKNFGIFKFPTDHQPVRMSSFAEMFQINGSSEPQVQEAAIKLAEYITGEEVVNEYIDQYGSPALKQFNTSEQSPHTSEMAEMIKDGNFLITDQALPQTVVQKLFEAQDAVVLNEWTPEQAAKEIQKAAESHKSNSN
ncbi:ABC transporter substrate-binding protein [Paenibacillus bouchesdurhonensis]|uniref:ABC transporter substrate-binding protein n=1 Tax=Paenibacillus bouchesdurhonensis TaxID=1870990 RepID=UPI000DA5F7D9|nr:extracellular solute-binding protein [Paenibacillus bouchesdurhonensis]